MQTSSRSEPHRPQPPPVHTDRLVFSTATHADVHRRSQDLGGNAEGLHLILAEAFAGDERAEAFLSRLLGMGDYNLFCTLMKAGGGALKVSLEDLRKLGDQYGSGSDSDE